MLVRPPIRYIVPNLLTVASSFCGFMLLYLAATSEYASGFYLAACFVPIASVIDGFDGRVARLLHGESRFGAEFDSLSDMFTFGVAPAFLAYFWGLDKLGIIGGFAAFLFLIAAMARLARFNLGASAGHSADRYFQGLPAPMGGMGIASVVGIQAGLMGQNEMSGSASAWFAAYVVMLALLMVSTVPFRSFKDLRMTPLNLLIVGTVLSGVAVVSIVVDPMTALGFAFFGYFLGNVIAAVFISGEIAEVEEDPWSIPDDEWMSSEDEDGHDAAPP